MDTKNSHPTDHTLEGTTILDRLAALKVPAGLKAFAAAFKAEQAKYVAAGKLVLAAKAKRDAALGAIATADDSLHAHVLELADALVGAKLGDRKNPFRAYSSHAPSRLVALAYSEQTLEVTRLLAKLAAKKPPKAVSQVAAQCKASVSKVELALRQLTGPQAAYSKALAARDGLLVGWTKAHNKLKLNARAVWADEPETARALFAPPERLQQSHAKKRSKKAPKPPASAPAPAPGTIPPATP